MGSGKTSLWAGRTRSLFPVAPEEATSRASRRWSVYKTRLLLQRTVLQVVCSSASYGLAQLHSIFCLNAGKWHARADFGGWGALYFCSSDPLCLLQQTVVASDHTGTGTSCNVVTYA